MREFGSNYYEQAFESWLTGNHIQYICIDDSKKASLGRSKVKSFDFIVYPRDGGILLVELKGRSFKGTSFAKLAGFECWVTADDIDGLSGWQGVFGAGHRAIFVFAYRIEKIDVDFDGREVFDFNGGKYVFFAVKLSDYCRFMKLRSPKWQTVTLPADKFKKCALQAEEFFL